MRRKAVVTEYLLSSRHMNGWSLHKCSGYSCSTGEDPEAWENLSLSYLLALPSLFLLYSRLSVSWRLSGTGMSTERIRAQNELLQCTLNTTPSCFKCWSDCPVIFGSSSESLTWAGPSPSNLLFMCWSHWPSLWSLTCLHVHSEASSLWFGPLGHFPSAIPPRTRSAFLYPSASVWAHFLGESSSPALFPSWHSSHGHQRVTWLLWLYLRWFPPYRLPEGQNSYPFCWPRILFLSSVKQR